MKASDEDIKRVLVNLGHEVAEGSYETDSEALFGILVFAFRRYTDSLNESGEHEDSSYLSNIKTAWQGLRENIEMDLETFYDGTGTVERIHLGHMTHVVVDADDPF